MTIPYPAPKRAQELRLHLRLHQLFVFRRPSVRPVGAAHFTLIPGCRVAPFAFTVSPVGAKINEPRNRSYNAKISSNAIDFVFKPLMQRYQHANFIFATFSPVRRKEKRIEFPLSPMFYKALRDIQQFQLRTSDSWGLCQPAPYAGTRSRFFDTGSVGMSASRQLHQV